MFRPAGTQDWLQAGEPRTNKSRASLGVGWQKGLIASGPPRRQDTGEMARHPRRAWASKEPIRDDSLGEDRREASRVPPSSARVPLVLSAPRENVPLVPNRNVPFPGVREAAWKGREWHS